MTTQEKIEWLNNHNIKKAEISLLMDDTESFAKQAELNAEYEAFLEDEEFNDEEKSMDSDDLTYYLMKDLDNENNEQEKENEVEKNSFNDNKLFIEEFKNYFDW